MSKLKWIVAVVLIISLAGVAWGQVMPTGNEIPAGENVTPATEGNVTPGMEENVTPGMEENVTPSINVTSNQTVEGNETIANVTIDEVVSDGPGWIVIHNSLFGTLGGVIGFSPVESGTNSNVTVTIDTLAATDQLIAELHKDLGQEGVFEYPAIDLPQMVDGEPVSANFTITADNFTVKNLTELAGNMTGNVTGNVTPVVGNMTPVVGNMTPTAGNVTPAAANQTAM
ncbi:hypothetical protein F8E02_07635 [Methanoculleus sp. Wushi-C6]|uniref:DUF7282 domain-containing protein n=1 Tax=Methanoculleus caldifontis TaxID=2651577 RepID=A0ABU3X3B2_9EURY|nr:hypothetical protein [Methanoculleus sp. Wushi-C6]MDV2481881.1 hypothetical protein [Methanoculleus sp. Wushi-C6]